jgi:hypothetical protein
MKYHKINGLYKRWRKDLHKQEELPENTKFGDFIIGEFSCPEFEYLFDNKWIWKEKLDGTNIRLYLKKLEEYNNIWSIEIKGRTDDAQLPKDLVNWIEDWFLNIKDELSNIFNNTNQVILYGEGVGEKIQGGGLFGKQHFKLFDILIGNYWLKPIDVYEIGCKLNLDTPHYWEGTIEEAIDSVKKLPKSSFGDFIMEGYVGCPSVRLNDASGNRIVTKIKVVDFVK